MIAGRLHWRDLDPRKGPPKLGGRNNLAAFDFPHGSLVLTEAGTKRRASLHLVQGEQALASPRPRRPRRLLHSPRSLPRRPHRRKPHPQASPHRPAHPLRHRQRLLRRDPPRRPTLSHHTNPQAHAEEWQRLFTATRETLQTLDRPASTPKPKNLSPKKSPPSAPRWPSTAASANPARAAAHPSSASATPTTKPTTAPVCQTGGKVLADRSPLPPPRHRLAPHPRRTRSAQKEITSAQPLHPSFPLRFLFLFPRHYIH